MTEKKNRFVWSEKAGTGEVKDPEKKSAVESLKAKNKK